jgi:hypothetical protein
MHYSHIHAGLAALAIARASAQDSLSTLPSSITDDFGSSTTATDFSSATGFDFDSELSSALSDASSTTASSGSFTVDPTITGTPVTVYQMSAADDRFQGAIETEFNGPIYASIMAVVCSISSAMPSPFADIVQESGATTFSLEQPVPSEYDYFPYTGWTLVNGPATYVSPKTKA